MSDNGIGPCRDGVVLIGDVPLMGEVNCSFDGVVLDKAAIYYK